MRAGVDVVGLLPEPPADAQPPSLLRLLLLLGILGVLHLQLQLLHRALGRGVEGPLLLQPLQEVGPGGLHPQLASLPLGPVVLLGERIQCRRFVGAAGLDVEEVAGVHSIAVGVNDRCPRRVMAVVDGEHVHAPDGAEARGDEVDGEPPRGIEAADVDAARCRAWLRR